MAAPGIVAPRRLYTEVVQRIVERIVDGKYPPGCALPSESEMSEQFGVSRTVVREALRVLGHKGLIDVKHGSGTRVSARERWDALDTALISAQLGNGAIVSVMHDLLEARTIVECGAAGLAARRAQPPDLARMRAALATMADALHDSPRYAAADALFHRAVMEAAGNKVLLRMAEPMRELLEFAVGMTDSVQGALTRALADHQAIYRAIERGDAAGARAAMLRHLMKTERDLNRLMPAKETV